MITLSVGDVMTDAVRTTTPAETAKGVSGRLRAESIGSLVVCDPETEALLGIVTESDIVNLVASGADTGSVTVSEFMSTDLIVIGSDKSIHAAATVMRDNSVRRLPVVDDGHLVGILTTTNLVHYLPRLRNTILRERTLQA